MGKDADVLPNPFRATPVDPRKVYQPLTARELSELNRAPRRTGPGTQVTVRSYDIPGLYGPDEHMYVEYDDGREKLIARGGPSSAGGLLMGSARVVGGVTPAAESRDYERGGRVMYRGFVPNKSADTTAAPARLHAKSLDADERAYDIGANSNSFAADVTAALFGVRPGDNFTPGYRQRLNTAPRRRAPVDLSPALRRPAG